MRLHRAAPFAAPRSTLSNVTASISILPSPTVPSRGRPWCRVRVLARKLLRGGLVWLVGLVEVGEPADTLRRLPGAARPSGPGASDTSRVPISLLRHRMQCTLFHREPFMVARARKIPNSVTYCTVYCEDPRDWFDAGPRC